MSERASVIPATLSFLAIYNPSLSTSDETFEEQIVYYYAKPNDGRQKPVRMGDESEVYETKEEKDEKLRQIGLAQGMVSFAKNFSDGKAVDCIETEKSRIILHELESNWWLLASIDLTRLPSSSTKTADQSDQSQPYFEFSAREICPPALLLQQVVRAHHVFLLHQAPSIADLYKRIARAKFCSILKRFWDGFIWSWDVLLHGNPAVSILNGLKLAAGGELSIGVGEEEWGSGEREVLEGFIGRTEGLVDLIVSRFGDAPRSSGVASTNSALPKSSQNLGVHLQDSGASPRSCDGVVFSGIGAITRHSVRNIANWMEWLHQYSDDAYGVRDSPSSDPRRKRRKIPRSRSAGTAQKLDTKRYNPQSSLVEHNVFNSKPKDTLEAPGIPPSIVSVNRTSHITAGEAASKNEKTSTQTGLSDTNAAIGESSSSTDTLVKYLTLGVYGSAWGIPSGRPFVHSQEPSSQISQASKVTKSLGEAKSITQPNASGGYFLIGLQGELEEDVQAETTDPDGEQNADIENTLEDVDPMNRVMMRTVHVERCRRIPPDSNIDEPKPKEDLSDTYNDRLRVVVYIHHPFIFTFLFELQTDALAMPSFYRSLHHQLGPLQRPLLASTSPTRVSERLWEAASPKSTAPIASTQPIWDLVYDPRRLTVHTTIPNIPEPGSAPTEDAPWTRVEALNVHSQILNIFASTRRHTSEVERTCKTSRGWWVVWMRLPYSRDEEEQSNDDKAKTFREAFLIRKASDYVAPAARKSSGRFGMRDASGASGSGSGGWGPGKLAEGIGIDARRYIEGLLSLSR